MYMPNILKRLAAQMGKTLLSNVYGRAPLTFAFIIDNYLCLHKGIYEGLTGEVEKWTQLGSILRHHSALSYCRLIMCSGGVFHSYMCFDAVIYMYNYINNSLIISGTCICLNAYPRRRYSLT